MRHPAARGPGELVEASRAHLHALDEGRDRRPRREHQLRAPRGDHRRGRRFAAARPCAEGIHHARDHAAERGVIIADTKFEFGRLGDTIILADEVLTPDSSRFWPGDTYEEAATSPASTSSSSATGSPPIGTRLATRRVCPRTSSTPPRPSTSRLTRPSRERRLTRRRSSTQEKVTATAASRREGRPDRAFFPEGDLRSRVSFGPVTATTRMTT